MYGSPNMIAVEFHSPITMVNILPGKSQQTTILTSVIKYIFIAIDILFHKVVGYGIIRKLKSILF